MRSRFWALAEGLAVAGLGLCMLMLAFSQDYWMLLNPKFRWLTGSAGGLLALCGLAIALAPGRRAGPLRPLLLAALLVVGLGWDLGAWSQPGVGTGGAAFNPQQRQRIASRLSHGGHEYIKINLAELFLLAEKKPPAWAGKRYVFRGQVVNTPALEAKGRFAVVRLSVWCCLADAVWVGFSVSLPPGAEPPAQGQWVRLYGRLEPRPAAPDQSEAVMDKVTNRLTAINERCFFQSEEVAPIPAPSPPYMFQTRSQEPYAY
ncbi:MAG: hypothetical protein K9K66_13935 [Desulfarculaceae bacterium]|nr:hypothetical protein [Desulfarculaceae bacterium]MCF8074171.1 hypothetical protein [Desulfarculaceae bacterium]MCF8102752.1 hypothetical protein [Desulfarculaceae bacterium]MCF8116393.1 hypothetical protein [Desulfarculaceae bacterium]